MAVAGLRRRHAEEEGESVFVSMTDLTVSFLFILLVLLAFFATQIQPEEMVPLSEHDALKRGLSEARAAIIRLEDALANERTRLDRLKQERRVLAVRLAEAIEAKRQLEESLANVRRRIDRLEQEKRALITRLVQAEDANRVLEEALANVRRRIDRLDQEKRVLVDRLAEANRTIAELRALVEALRGQLAVADTKIAAFSAQILDLQRDLEFMRTERDGARERVALLEVRVEQLTQSLADCRRERDRLRMQLVDMLDPDPLASYLEDASVAREALLERLAERIRGRLPRIQVTVDTTDGVIRFRADELFPRGTWRIRRGSLAERVSHAVGDALVDTLPCYTLSPTLGTEVSCTGAVAAIETIQIEGHTDDVGLSAELQAREQMHDNYDLSARRGAETLRVMTRKRPELHAFLSLRRQPVLSFAGYGETRPINQADTEEARAQNRRIDIRFILQTPRNLLEVEQIRFQLTRRRADLPSVVDENRP